MVANGTSLGSARKPMALDSSSEDEDEIGRNMLRTVAKEESEEQQLLHAAVQAPASVAAEEPPAHVAAYLAPHPAPPDAVAANTPMCTCPDVAPLCPRHDRAPRWLRQVEREARRTSLHWMRRVHQMEERKALLTHEISTLRRQLQVAGGQAPRPELRRPAPTAPVVAPTYGYSRFSPHGSLNAVSAPPQEENEYVMLPAPHNPRPYTLPRGHRTRIVRLLTDGNGINDPLTPEAYVCTITGIAMVRKDWFRWGGENGNFITFYVSRQRMHDEAGVEYGTEDEDTDEEPTEYNFDPNYLELLRRERSGENDRRNLFFGEPDSSSSGSDS